MSASTFGLSPYRVLRDSVAPGMLFVFCCPLELRSVTMLLVLLEKLPPIYVCLFAPRQHANPKIII